MKHFVVDIDCFANINLHKGCAMKCRGGVVAMCGHLISEWPRLCRGEKIAGKIYHLCLLKGK